MSKLVIELQKDCVNPTISYASLYQKAYFIAKKLNQREMVEFLKMEIDGYKQQKDVPQFRYVDVVYRAKNVMRGCWIPVDIPYDNPLVKYLRMPAFQSVGEMESFLKSGEDTLIMSISAELHHAFIAMSRDKIPLEICAHFSKNQYKKILETGKRIISDWAIELEEKGILGEEYQFSQQEKEIAKAMTVMNFYGAVNGANIIGSMTNSSAVINNNSFDFDALKQLITKIEADLENAKSAESEKADVLKEQVSLLKKSIEEKDETSAMDLLKNIAAGAISSGIWSVGSTITTFLASMA